MNNEFNNIIKAVKSVKLSESEKAIMKASVISGVIPSPFSNVTNSMPSRLYYRGYTEYIGNYLNLLIKQNNYMTALILAIMLAISGGTSVVAENAIPGDALYAVKTSINEPVAGLFAVSKEANATWQERLVERRLEEAQKVATQGTLSTSTQVAIQANVNNQVIKFTEAVKNLSEDKSKAVNSTELAVRLESALHAHEDILDKATREGKISTSTRESAIELISSLKNNEDKVKGNRERMEATLGDNVNASSTASSTQVSASNKQAVAEKILDNVKTKYQEEEINLATSTRSKIESQLTEVEKTLTDGKTAVTEGDYDTAREKFQEVIKSANQTRVNVLTGSIKSNIEDDMDMDHEDEGKGDGDNRNRNSLSTIRKDDEGKRATTSTSTIRKSNDGRNENESSRKAEIED